MTLSSDLLALLAVTPQSPEDLVLRLLIELGAQVVDASEGSLLVYDREKNDLVFAMNVGGSVELIGQRVPMNQGLTGLAAATREVQIGAPTFTGIKQAAERATASGGPEAVIAAPMMAGDDLVGVITAVSFSPGKRFTAKDGELYARLATVAGVVVEQRRGLNAAASGSRSGGENEQSIAAAIVRISKAGPAAVAGTARILTEIAAFVGDK